MRQSEKLTDSTVAAQGQPPEDHDSSVNKAKDADKVDITNKELKSQMVKLSNDFKEGVNKTTAKGRNSVQDVEKGVSKAEDKMKQSTRKGTFQNKKKPTKTKAEQKYYR